MSLQLSILKIVVYFDLFKYPVTLAEIKKFLDQPFYEAEFRDALNKLLSGKLLFNLGEFYSIQNDKSLAARRVKGNAAAAGELRVAARSGAFLATFPFVRAIAVSGSLSKNYADEHSDMDFFVITAPNRLWITRSLIFLYLRCARLLGSRKQVCVNYLVDEQALEIQEKNFYTAIEVLTLIPLQGLPLLDTFLGANRWCSEYFPNYVVADISAAAVPQRRLKWLESLLPKKTGDAIERRLLAYFSRRWKNTYDKEIYTQSGYRAGAVRAQPHTCTQMPDFQEKILKRFEASLQKVRSRMPQEVAL